MPEILHRRIHNVSHFHAVVASKGQALPDDLFGGTLVTFYDCGVIAATAWDDNATVEPHVEITVSGFGSPLLGSFPDLLPAAAGNLIIGPEGLEAGNSITGDTTLIAVPAGRYRALVLLDTLTPMTARRLHVHLTAVPASP